MNTNSQKSQRKRKRKREEVSSLSLLKNREFGEFASRSLRLRHPLRRLLCLLLGHRPGSEVFRYAKLPKTAAQWPSRPVFFVLIGRECDRCGHVAA
jgi:hypothetical protein